MIAKFLSPSDFEWAELLKDLPFDFYHLPEYANLSAQYEGGTPCAFYASHEASVFFAPLLLRNIPRVLHAPTDWCDAVSPYGYPTPLLKPAGGSEVLDKFLQIFRQMAKAKGIISVFFRLHPLFPLPKDALVRHGELANHGQTIFVDLSRSYEDFWAQTIGGHKENIKRLIRNDFKAIMDDWRFYKQFVELYHITMKRVGASEFYFFPKDYFAQLRLALCSRLHLCTVLSPSGEVAAGGLFPATNGIVQYHLSASADTYRSQAPTKLMLDAVRRWAKQEGYHVLHLGGGVGGQADALFRFKSGFSKDRANFYTYRMILDEEKYAALVHCWEKHYHQTSETKNQYFPVYRSNLSG
jgi:hypothetical protein